MKLSALATRLHPRSDSAHRRATLSNISAALVFALSLSMSIAGCGDESEEPTVAEQLEQLTGRNLTPAEIAERQETAAFLCNIDDQVLAAVWEDLPPDALTYQDWVFATQCPDRVDVYANATGRFRSEETTTTTTLPTGE